VRAAVQSTSPHSTTGLEQATRPHAKWLQFAPLPALARGQKVPSGSTATRALRALVAGGRRATTRRTAGKAQPPQHDRPRESQGQPGQVAAVCTLARSGKVRGRTPFPRCQERSLRASVAGGELPRDSPPQAQYSPYSATGLEQARGAHAKGLRFAPSPAPARWPSSVPEASGAVPAGLGGGRRATTRRTAGNAQPPQHDRHRADQGGPRPVAAVRTVARSGRVAKLRSGALKSGPCGPRGGRRATARALRAGASWRFARIRPTLVAPRQGAADSTPRSAARGGGQPHSAALRSGPCGPC
jgi:hypothetical protein